MKEGKIGTMAPVCFTAASEFSNFPVPARNGKTAHNSQNSTPYFAICGVVISRRSHSLRLLLPPCRLTKYEALFY